MPPAIPKPQSSPVVDAIRNGAKKLTPQELETLDLAMTPDVVTVLRKMLGPEAAQLLDQVGEYHQQAKARAEKSFRAMFANPRK